MQSRRFSGRLAYGEGISERNPLPRLINIVVVRRQEDVGLLRTDRLPQAVQVFVFLAKDKGDYLRVAPSADEKKVRSFTAYDDVHAWWPDSGSGAERQ